MSSVNSVNSGSYLFGTLINNTFMIEGALNFTQEEKRSFNIPTLISTVVSKIISLSNCSDFLYQPGDLSKLSLSNSTMTSQSLQCIDSYVTGGAAEGTQPVYIDDSAVDLYFLSEKAKQCAGFFAGNFSEAFNADCKQGKKDFEVNLLLMIAALLGVALFLIVLYSIALRSKNPRPQGQNALAFQAALELAPIGPAGEEGYAPLDYDSSASIDSV